MHKILWTLHLRLGGSPQRLSCWPGHKHKHKHKLPGCPAVADNNWQQV